MVGGGTVHWAGWLPRPMPSDCQQRSLHGDIGGASLDVYGTEPLPADSPFWSHPKVVLTPHNAADSDPEVISDVIAGQLLAHERGEPLRNVVDITRQLHRLMERTPQRLRRHAVEDAARIEGMRAAGAERKSCALGRISQRNGRCDDFRI